MSTPDFDQTLEDTSEDLAQLAQETLDGEDVQSALEDETRDDEW